MVDKVFEKLFGIFETAFRCIVKGFGGLFEGLFVDIENILKFLEEVSE